ncbi:hypothetical protein [Christiangramia sabulilitoris]|uniref:Uncharacterized protein n=1 Tax=Christiangramia sabulilitoris TaxID=2583991 RepID=A0A550HZ17_9FLAO|nr:hypothetical protein [Christiangramia sabulilitoris]TRO63973.1 hypothetical protein FGM01_10715 [Christiangramia sabulilitoris]
MFSNGQLIFAGLFVIAFIIIMIFSYRKDIKLHQKYYKGSIYVLVGFIVFILILFLIKSRLNH